MIYVVTSALFISVFAVLALNHKVQKGEQDAIQQKEKRKRR
jgi:hypothetical protein